MTTATAPASTYAQTWTLAMPPLAEPYTANARGTWKQWIEPIRQMRDAAATMARHAGMPPLERARIVYVWEPPDNRRHDTANLYPTAKAYIDGLTKAGYFPDDDSWRVIGPDPRPGFPRGIAGRMTLYITVLPPLAAITCITAAAAEQLHAASKQLAFDYEHRTRVEAKRKRVVTIAATDPSYIAELRQLARHRGWAAPDCEATP